MIPRTQPLTHIPAWQGELAQAITDPEILLSMLDLSPALASQGATKDFQLKVPQGFVSRMKKGDANDPLLRQVLPINAENDLVAGYSIDPLQETSDLPAAGLLRKYRSRALLTVTGACGIHCRYCFRRHFPYGDNNPAQNQWQQALDYLANDLDVSEVILSGGDPMSLRDSKLSQLVVHLEAIPHIKRLRIHSRLLVVLPARIDNQFIAWIKSTRLQTVVVIHVNHPNEINDEVIEALSLLKESGVTLLNQSVLLKGVNDNATTLAELSERLMLAGVLPYYLHQLDKVQGAAHFEVKDTVAFKIMDKLHATLPGYLVPRLCREEPGAAGKTLLWPR